MKKAEFLLIMKNTHNNIGNHRWQHLNFILQSFFPKYIEFVKIKNVQPQTDFLFQYNMIDMSKT